MLQTEFQLKLAGQLGTLKTFAKKYTPDVDEASDLVQETVLKALRFWTSFKDDTNFVGWLHMIMRNTFYDVCQAKKKRGYETISEELMPKEVYRMSAVNEGETSLTMEALRRAIDHLSKEYSVPFIMFYEGYRYHEIADCLSVPIGTIKTRIHIARQLLKKELASFRYYAATA